MLVNLCDEFLKWNLSSLDFEKGFELSFEFKFFMNYQIFRDSKSII